MRRDSKYQFLAWNRIYSKSGKIYTTDALGYGLWCYDLVHHSVMQIEDTTMFSIAGLKCPQVKLKNTVKMWEEDPEHEVLEDV